MEEYEKLYNNRISYLIENHCKSKSDYSILNNYDNFKDLMNEEVFKKIIKSKHRRQQKRYRCNRKLKEILLLKEQLDFNNIDNKLLWVTCTFNNKELEYKEETRAKKIDKWIHEHFIIALLHIDYGKKNEREHYHFIGLTTEDIEPAINKKTGKQARTDNNVPLYELIKKTYKIGHEPDIEVISRKDEDYNLKKISNYLIKLQNHYSKETVKNRRIRLIF